MLRKIAFFAFLSALYYCGRMDSKPEQAPYELAGGSSAYRPYSPYNLYTNPYRPYSRWPYGPYGAYGVVRSGYLGELPESTQVDINELME